MDDEEWVAGIGDATIDGLSKADTPVNLSQQHCAGVRGEAAAVEIGMNFFGTET
jgi:hypothetical protein